MPDESTGPQGRHNGASGKDSPRSSSSSKVSRTPITKGLMTILSSRDALHAAASSFITAPTNATILRALTSRNLGNLTQISEGLITLLSSPDALLVAASTDIIAPMRATLQAFTSKDLGTLNHGTLNQRLLEFIQAMIRGEDFRRIIEAFGSYIVAHSEEVAGLLKGIILRANPLALAVLGPVPGSLAATGDVAARSLVTLLQAAGMINAVAIPLACGLTVGAAAAAAALTATPLATRLRAKF